MLNPLSMMNPQQRQQLEQFRVLGRRVKAQIHKYPSNRMEVCLTAEDQEAKGCLGALIEQLCQSIGETLSMFAIEGEVVDH